MQKQQQQELILGEYFAELTKHCGKIASDLLFKSRWGYTPPEWFDHRHHLLHPERWFNDFWTLLAHNVLHKLPLHGTVLDLCSGDGFYGYHFFRKRAKEIVCVEFDEEVHRQAQRLHHADNITYVCGDVLKYEAPDEHYDVVSIRGAIEHFSQENQQRIFELAKKSLKVGGWFVGDTPANPNKLVTKDLPSHENEWADELEMRKELVCAFDCVETQTYESVDRTTLFWRCQKTAS
jgi:SAM-dependent methyltransferase